MRDLLLLLSVGVMFACGYGIMDRLDRWLEKLHIEEDPCAERTEAESFKQDRLENGYPMCYNSGCKKRVRHPAARPGGREERTWKHPGRTRACFFAPSGLTDRES